MPLIEPLLLQIDGGSALETLSVSKVEDIGRDVTLRAARHGVRRMTQPTSIGQLDVSRFGSQAVLVETSGVDQALAKNYLATTYRNHQYTRYPLQLASYLADRFGMKPGMTVLDVGCGRGEITAAFSSIGLVATGIDQSPQEHLVAQAGSYVQADISVGLPFPDGSFDFVFNKSVIEHFYYPEKILHEMLRVMKGSGKTITLTPSFPHFGHRFYQDFTHRSPFTIESLTEIHSVVGYGSVATEKFIQLPRVWTSRVLRILSNVVRVVFPNVLGRFSKTVRFSKEVMLLAEASKEEVES